MYKWDGRSKINWVLTYFFLINFLLEKYLLDLVLVSYKVYKILFYYLNVLIICLNILINNNINDDDDFFISFRVCKTFSF